MNERKLPYLLISPRPAKDGQRPSFIVEQCDSWLYALLRAECLTWAGADVGLIESTAHEIHSRILSFEGRSVDRYLEMHAEPTLE